MPKTSTIPRKLSKGKALGYGAVLLGSLLATTACGFEPTIQFDAHIEIFSQAPSDQIDVLWVIDDTTTMGDDQERLVEQLGSFAEVLDGSDVAYQMAAVTTSVAIDGEAGLDGAAPSVIFTPEQGSAIDFADALLVGTDGSDKERGLYAALAALYGQPADPQEDIEPFVRDDSDLLVIFVSDEDDCSDDGALEGQSPTSCYTSREQLIPVPEVVDALVAVHGDPNRVLVAGILGTEASDCEGVYHGSRYQQVAHATGGWVADICSEDWSGALARLGRHATGIRDTFQLRRAAEPSSLSVFVDQVALEEDPQRGWTYDPETRFLRFAEAVVPERGASIEVAYRTDEVEIYAVY